METSAVSENINVGLSLSSGPIAQNELVKILEALLATGNAQVQELDEEEKESEEITALIIIAE